MDRCQRGATRGLRDRTVGGHPLCSVGPSLCKCSFIRACYLMMSFRR